MTISCIGTGAMGGAIMRAVCALTSKFDVSQIKVTDKMPQRVATAFGNLSDQLLGAEYTFIAYLGSQSVNGTNHAVLAEQLVTTGKDTKNVVVIIFNEKPGQIDLTLVNIERVIESGGDLGGIVVDVKDIDDEAADALNTVLNGYVGMKITPVTQLGTQVTKGCNYILFGTAEPVVQDPKQKAVIIIVNKMTGELSISDLLGTKTEAMALGYAFSWLKKQNTSLGTPVEEW